MNEYLERTELIYGPDVMERLAKARVAVFGLGGVGGYAVEALCRSGIGALDLIDHDEVALSNINRQILATTDTIGEKKVDVAAKRIKSISSECVVRTYPIFYLPDGEDPLDFHDYDYVVDAIDTVTGKLYIIEKAKVAGVPIISAMGAGNKTDPAAFEVSDLYKTFICPLARVLRRECKKRGIDSLKVVYSKEEPIRTATPEVPGSTAFVPSVAGLIIAGEVINDLAAQV